MLKNKTVNAVFWNFLEQLSKRGVTLIVTLLLARFLVPEDFGLLAMMAVFIAVATTLMDSGIKQAVIRKKDATQDDFNTAFYTNLVLGVVSYAILFGAAPFIADFYEEPRLINLIRAAGVVVLINAFQVIQGAVLSRELNFRAQLKVSVPASVISGTIAIVTAYLGAGVWALITQIVLNSLLLTLMLWWIQRWRPTLSYNYSSFKEIYGFGYKLFIARFITISFKNIYVVIIAKVFSAGMAGLYFFADRIKEVVVSQLVSAIQNVTYPALSTLQDDNIKLKSAYRQVMQATTFMLFPGLLMLAALAEPLFEVALPQRWMPAIPYLQLMCVATLIYPMHAINLNILKVKGRTDLYLGISIFKKFLICLILFLTYRYGIIAILMGKMLQSMLAYIPNSYFSSRLIDYRVSEQVRDCSGSLLLATSVSLGVYALVQFLDILPIYKLVLLGGLGIVTYLGLAKVLKIPAYHMAEQLVLERMGKSRIGKKVSKRYG